MTSNRYILDSRLDIDTWKSVLLQMPEELQDIYFQPEYINLHRFNEKIQGKAFVFQHQNKIWHYPFLLSPISFSYFDVEKENVFDIESAYGYGGPITNSEDKVFIQEANDSFLDWANEKGIIAEFIRFHPLLNNHRWIDQRLEVIEDRQTVALDLNKLIDGIKTFSPKARNKIRRSVKQGVNVFECVVDSNIDDFVEIYRKTMDRLDAESYYYFDDFYFENIAELIKEQGMMIKAEHEGYCVAAALFLKGKKSLHYHLSGTNPDRMITGAINQILFEAAEIAKTRDLESFHYGGGRTNSPDDSLLSFKKSMGTDQYMYYIGKRVLNERCYLKIKKSWKKKYPSLVPTYGNRLFCYKYIK